MWFQERRCHVAEWIFGILLCMLLCIACVQLRGLKKLLKAQLEAQKPPSEDAGLSFEAWLQEIESRGTEIIGRMEQERRAAESALTQATTQAAQIEVVTPSRVSTSTVHGSPGSSRGAQGSEQRSPGADGVGEVRVQDWVRRQGADPEPTDNKAQTSWTAARRNIGQDWSVTQRKVMEMANRGVPIAAIAKSLGLSHGEVQLILNKSAFPA
jgi:hypothetical protein